MGQLMSGQIIVSWSLPRSKVDILLMRKRLCAEILIHLHSVTACMHPHLAKVGTKTGFHERSHVIWQRTSPTFAAIQPIL